MEDIKNKIGFIGAGNMASSLIAGLVKSGYDKKLISIADPSAAQIRKMKGLDIRNHVDNLKLSEWADIVILAVKPQIVQKVCKQITRDKRPLLISIAAGIRTDTIIKWLGFETAVIRVMPNTPALVRQGMSALYANSETSTDQQQQAESILESVGNTLWLDHEDTMDLVTAISGSGPAYFFLLMETLIAAARNQGLSDEVARKLVLQTALGAAVMASESGVEPAELRRQVTSPGGTTERAIETFLNGGLEKLTEDAITAATERSIELSKQLDKAH